MALQYLDTSAIAKRYVAEPGSAWVNQLVSSETVAISELAFVEMASVLARRSRDGLMSRLSAEDAFELFSVDANTYTVVDLTRGLVLYAASLMQQADQPLRLRSLDALHLASALASFERAQSRGEPVGSFVTADRVLFEMAQSVGLRAVNPEDHP